MKFRFLLLLLLMGHIGLAQAEIYKYVSPDGHVTYSSEPIKGAKKLNLGPLPTTKPFKATGEEEFHVRQEEQKRRDDERRKILEDELATEQKQLDDARQKLQDAEDTPMVYHDKSGHTFRNVAGYDENVKAAQSEVDLHEKNVEALKTELSNIK
jgi:Lon protease-like protein